jgi:hypothetical protein
VVLQVQEMEKFHAKVAMLDATIRAVMSHGEHVFLDTRQYRMRHPDFRAQTIKRLQTAEFENMPWNKETKIGKNMRKCNENVIKNNDLYLYDYFDCFDWNYTWMLWKNEI